MGEFLNPKGISAQSPGLARRAYPGNAAHHKNSTPTGLRLGRSRRRNPVGVEPVLDPISQGSSCLATLGFVAESLWDSAKTSPYIIILKSLPFWRRFLGCEFGQFLGICFPGSEQGGHNGAAFCGELVAMGASDFAQDAVSAQQSQ